MIIIGYPGIGKTTLAGKDNYIDLESSNFNNSDNKKPDNWYVFYCNIAEDLSKQGYNVFVSSHAAVRNRLAKYSKEKVIIVTPSIELRDKWVNKLHDRWKASLTEKDYKAFVSAEDDYVLHIVDMINSGLEIKQIKSMDYVLQELIEE